MAKKKDAKPETKSEFLRKVLGKNPDLDYQQVNRRWAKAGHAGEISNALYYKVRGELGIRTEWVWVKEEKPGPKSPTTGASGEVYQFKITLLDTRPPIWRHIQVGDGTLDRLHEQIQTAMGWTNSHMYHFRIDGKLYGDPMLLQETFEELGYGDSTTVRLSEILPGGAGGSGSSTSTISGTAGCMRCSSRVAARPRRGSGIRSAWRGHGPARRRTWAASGAIWISSPPSPTPSTSSTRRCGSGSVASSTPRRSARWRRPGG